MLVKHGNVSGKLEGKSACIEYSQCPNEWWVEQEDLADFIKVLLELLGQTDEIDKS